MNREEHFDLEEGIRAATESMRASMWSSLPGIVKAVDLSKQTVSVQPSIQGIVTSPGGETKNVDLPLLVDVPLVWPRAGGFALTFPVAVGDEVLVIFSSRCIDSWWTAGGFENVPAEERQHDLADGFALLAPTSQPKKLSAVSSANVQLRNEAGDTLIEITPDGKVQVTATSEINMTAPTMNITADVNITGAVTIEGELTQTGGEATLTDLAVPISTHVHTGVQTGGGNTGAPLP